MSAPLSADRWVRVEALFDAASGLPAEQRESFLAAHCGDDAELNREVGSLLRHDADDESPLVEAVRVTAASVVKAGK